MSGFSKLSEYNRLIAEFCDNRYLRTYCDVLWCRLRYGFSPNEYFRWTAYNFSGLKRNTFVTTRREKALWKENDKEIQLIFGDKPRFLKEYSKFTKRRFVDTTRDTFENFEKLVKEKKKVFIKPLWTSGGVGTQLYEYTTDEDIKRIYDEMSAYDADHGMLAEEVIVQHPHMKLVGEHSVNTIRVATYTCNGKAYILGCALRMGGNGCTDNYSAGGTCATVDAETGVVVSECFRDEDHHWIRHPYTNTILPGFQIPHWDKVMSICKEAALYKPGAVYIGWDVAIGEDDVLLVEGNCNHGIFQTEDKIGKYGIIRRARKGLLD